MKFSFFFFVGNNFPVPLVALHGNDTLLEVIVTMKSGGLVMVIMILGDT